MRQELAVEDTPCQRFGQKIILNRSVQSALLVSYEKVEGLNTPESFGVESRRMLSIPRELIGNQL
jgi:hypothetical protein